MSSKKERAKEVVETIIKDLCGRSGFDAAFNVGEDILDEIKGEMLETIMDDME